MEDGSIRVNKVNPTDYTDLSDYFKVTRITNMFTKRVTVNV